MCSTIQSPIRSPKPSSQGDLPDHISETWNKKKTTSTRCYSGWKSWEQPWKCATIDSFMKWYVQNTCRLMFGNKRILSLLRSTISPSFMGPAVINGIQLKDTINSDSRGSYLTRKRIPRLSNEICRLWNYRTLSSLGYYCRYMQKSVNGVWRSCSVCVWQQPLLVCRNCCIRYRHYG